MVNQREVMVVSDTDRRYVLATIGLCPCVAVIIMGKSLSALAHLDSSPMAYTLSKVIGYMRSRETRPLKAWIQMSLRGIPNTAKRAADILAENNVRLVDTIQSPRSAGTAGCTRNVAVNSRTGEFEYDFAPSEIDKVGMSYPEHLGPSSKQLMRIRADFFPELVWVQESSPGTYTWNADDFDTYLFARQRVRKHGSDTATYESMMEEYAARTAEFSSLLAIVEKEEQIANAKGYDDCPAELIELSEQR